MSRQPDLGPGPVHGSTMFKQESAPLSTDPHQHHSHQRAQAPPSSHVLHRPRAPSSGIHVHASQQSPRQPPALQPSQHQAPFPSSHASTHAIPPQHPSSFGHAGQASAGAHAQDIPYFATQPSPYSTSSASGTYSSAETPELMAPAHLNRSYPPIYHTPQSNSPASVSSPSGHEPHGRALYGQPTPPQIPPSMYPYPQTYPPMTSYGHAGAAGGGGGGGGGSGGGGLPHTSVLHPQPPPLMMSSQPLSTSVPTPQTSSGHAHPHALSSMGGSRRSSPTQPSLQRPGPPPSGTAAPTTPHTPHSTTGQGTMLGLPGSAGPPGTTGSNPSAAPGPIPATTPLVVRQDHNGVQWIAFEYSRDRVKMEYQIRCDVESVDVDKLSQEFKTDNCVYPRACCSKEQYRGNRLVYETECNTVGWALAELNPPLRGKRGLIQRAVDSWRNSNQDPRLRSRRVRRMAKVGTRKAGHAPQQQLQLHQQPQHQQQEHQHHQQHQQQDRQHQLLQQQQHQQQQPHHAGQMGPPGSSAPSGHAAAIGSAGFKSSPRGLPGPQLHHHHHAQPEGAAAPAAEGLSAGTAYDGHHQHHHHQAPNGSATTAASTSTAADLRHRQIFHPYPPHYPNDAGVGVPGLPPSSFGAMTQMGARKSSGAAAASSSSSTPRTSERNVELFGEIPEGRRRKFILVEDPHRGGMRVRVRVTLDQVEMKEIPDSYRKGNSVFPRSYFPMQMQSPRPHRFPEDEDGDDVDGDGRGRDNHAKPGRGRTLVPVPTLDGTEAEVPTPRMTRTKRKKEAALNDLGYRMSWSQSRVFAGRTIFLQRALDAYRNKMRSTMMATGQDASQIAPHFETRVGKRRWKERARRSGRQSTP